MSRWRFRLHRIWQKHRLELRGLVGGELPRWLGPGHADAPVGEIPVFEFHDVEPASFEAVLRFLAENDYRALTADELADRDGRSADGERLLVLSFDDALRSVRTVALPLLREFGFRAVLFVVPAVIGDGDGGPDLADVRSGRASRDDLREDAARRPFCTWAELEEMRGGGTFDVQSHSLSHHRIPISPRVLDFVHPGLDLWYGNFDLPVSTLDEGTERTRRPGAPIFPSAPRLSGRRAFVERPEFARALVDHAASAGPAFFASPRWRKELRRELRCWPADERGAYEPPVDTKAAVRREIVGAREALEARLPGLRVRHLAYPWEIGGRLADEVAVEAGMRSVLYGPTLPPAGPTTLPPAGPTTLPPAGPTTPLRIRRLPESYVVRLPGRGRATFAGLLRERAGRSGWPPGSSQ